MLGFATVTVVAPIQLEAEDNSYLSGCYISSFASGNNERASHVVVITCAGSHLTSPIGRINNEKRSGGHSSSRSVWVDLQTQPHVMLQSVTILQKNVSLSEVNLVLYDSREISESELVGKKFLYEEEKDHGNDIVPYFVHCVQRESRDHETRVSRTRESWTKLLLLIIRSFLVLSWLPKIALGSLHSVLVKRFDYSSSALQQLLLRITQIETLEEEVREQKRTLLSGRLLTMIVVDILTGITVACIISHYASVNDIYTYFCSWTKLLAGSVERLLQWLSGVPAGLKLNQPLTQALSAFFSYHNTHVANITPRLSVACISRPKVESSEAASGQSRQRGPRIPHEGPDSGGVYAGHIPPTNHYHLLPGVCPGDIYFSTVSAPEVNKHSVCPVAAPLVLHLHTWPTALSEVLVHAHTDDFPPKPSPDWKLIFSSIMFGENLL
ncbi:putative N-acetylglucosaminyl transferase component (Gpi1)-containing protein [Homarus americanus]|uniref:Putative N-acetylglucosaminyl transferase component (Gpi1)-containing protein n=1 Tax=Homarus americanus TaxID=6706 RepID=A0A8J5JZY4_HOMAM|nr:putative N-acetylglucosaminyl transferase component (Gpi1)-containing protein [Homarus americanus]